jgi:hypothetical protein
LPDAFSHEGFASIGQEDPCVVGVGFHCAESLHENHAWKKKGVQPQLVKVVSPEK